MLFAVPLSRAARGIFLSALVGLAGSGCGASADGDDKTPIGGRDGGGSDGQVVEPDDAGPDVYILDGNGDPMTDAAPIPEGCGDGERDKDLAEECDDGANKSGDGCSATCTLESGYACDPNGGACMAICGDGNQVGKESCDDMNTVPGDGCSATCTLESGWACPQPGMPCGPARCGDRIEVGGEKCDYGDAVNGDGCSDTCQVEQGWTCSAGACAATSCGDGIVAGDEVCDDGNAATPGCSADCRSVEAEYVCPVLGGACTKYTACGNGVFTPNEGCDDGALMSGDGCSASCQIELGYSCTGGTVCGPKCGDGMLFGAEVCDDGNATAGDGCSANCQLEWGFKCGNAGAACTRISCGDGVVEGLEQCDDGASAVKKNALGDGCTPDCKREPNCSNGTCTAVCGDGIVASGEVCDDGNNRNLDGCKADCSNTEPGFTCTDITTDPPNCIDLPLVLRDFKSFDNGTPGRHPDFNDENGQESGIVRDTLGWDVNNDGNADGAAPGGANLGMPRSVVYAKQGTNPDDTTTHGATSFNEWYHDSANGKTVLSTMRVCDADANGVRDGQYVFDNTNFFPLDGKGWQDPVLVPSATNREQNGSGGHNFGFTSEVRFWFTFKGTERLQFRGDDDVWVFINNKLAVDLGGVHGAQTQTITFNAGGDAVCSDDRCNGTRDLNLVVGNVYEVVVFQAERHETRSSYKLTLGNFFSKKTQCVPACGDGVRVSGEVCDEGGVCNGGANHGQPCNAVAGTGCPNGSCENQNTGGYGECAMNCLSRGPYCGDGVKQAEEVCDNGPANNGDYNGCTPICTAAPRCGDMKLDRAFGEQCDHGAANADATYNVCSKSCKLGPRCGDGVIQSDQGEECDDMVNKGTYGTGSCAPSCKFAPRCGDGVVQASQGEACDDGAAQNLGMYGGCNMDCSRAPYCGDKQKDAGEECDDGNANNFDGCSMQCKVETVLL